MNAVSFVQADPLSPELAEILRRHTEAMHADSPPESIHMLPASALAAPGISFFVLRDEAGQPVGMGAIKRLDDAHAELKSMHVLSELRGRGLAQQLLDHLLDSARKAGHSRISLETGSQPSFAPARRLYARAGFVECPPFGSYRPDPNSVFMTLDLSAP